MGYDDRWSRALNAARRTIDGLGRDDRATVVFFADLAEAVNQPSADQAALHALIDRAQLGAGRTRYAPAVQLARDILEVSDLPRREAVLITDFQKIGWDGQQDLRLPEGTVLTRIDLSDAEPTNIAVTDILLDRTQPSGRGRATVSARVVNAGATPVSDLSVALEIDGKEHAALDIYQTDSYLLRAYLNLAPADLRVNLSTEYIATKFETPSETTDDPGRIPVFNISAARVCGA